MRRGKYDPCENCQFSPQIVGEWAKCSVCLYNEAKRIPGHWVARKHWMWKTDTQYRCSQCGWINETGLKIWYGSYLHRKKLQPKYCPACGAEMEDQDV